MHIEIDERGDNTWNVSNLSCSGKGPDYLYITKEDDNCYVVDFQTGNDYDITGYDTLGEAVGAIIRHMIDLEWGS